MISEEVRRWVISLDEPSDITGYFTLVGICHMRTEENNGRCLMCTNETMTKVDVWVTRKVFENIMDIAKSAGLKVHLSN